MKKLILAFTIFSALTTALKAQSIDNVKKMYMYERYNTAATEAQNLIKSAPTNAEAYYWAIVSLVNNGKSAEATNLVNAGLAATKNDPLVTAAAATVDLFNAKKEDAKVKFEAAYNAAGKKAKAPIILAIGRAHGSVGKNKAEVPYAEAKLKELIAKEANNVEAITLLGDVYRRGDNGASKAVPEYMTALRVNSAYPVAAFRLGQIYQAQDNCAPMKENYTKATTIDPNFMPAWREMFEVFGNKESSCFDFNAAKGYLSNYTAATDQGIETDKITLKFLYFNNEYEKAIAQVNSIEQKYGQNTDADVFLYKALAAKGKGDSITAKNTFDYYFKVQSPEKITFRQYKYAGDIAATIVGKELEAIPYYQKAIALEADTKANLASYNGIVDIYEKKKDYTNAAMELKKLTSTLQTITQAQYYRLGRLYNSNKDFTNSIATFTEMFSKYASDFRAPLWIARNYAETDTSYNGDAVPHFNTYIDMVKADSARNKQGLAEAYTYLTVYNANKNNKATALEYLQKLKWIDPTNSAISQLEQYLGIAPKPVAAPKPTTPAAKTPVKTGTSTTPKTIGTKPATTKPTTTPPKTTTPKTPVKKA
jgi:predicted Zn-dependent protease